MNLQIGKSLEDIQGMFKRMDFSRKPIEHKIELEIPLQNKTPSVQLSRAFETAKNVLGDKFFDISFDGKTIKIEDKNSSKFDYAPIIASLVEYMMDKGMNIVPLPEIKLKNDLAESINFFGRTAYYDPTNLEVVLYTQGRHPKDVVRSFSHEMIHHIQNLENRLGGITTTNTAEDGNLQELEKEAYLQGNIIFREWEDTVKNKKQ
jgi:hypothetical protein